MTGGSRIVAAVTGRKALRSGGLWGVFFGLLVLASAAGYAKTFPTASSRATLARSFGANRGIAALLGPARGIDTVAGFTAWRTLGIVAVVGAIWGLLAATRLLRAEEEAGRWELLLSGPVTRRGATVQALLGLACGWVGLWAVTALCTLAGGASKDVKFPVTGSLFLATALVLPALVFLGVGALASQLAQTRRQANVVGGAVLGASYLLRMAADAGTGLTWLRWASPLGWAEELHPFAGSHLLPLVPVVLTVAVTASAAVGLAAVRDVGSGALPDREVRRARLALLDGPTSLSARLALPPAIAWTLALAAMGMVVGLVAQSASSVVTSSTTIEDMLARLGGHAAGAAAYIGFALVFAAALVALAMAGFIGATRGEEAEGHLDNLLVRPVARRRWLAGRVGVGAVIAVVASSVTGVAAWLGAATQDTGLGFGELARAGVNLAPPALFLLGTGVLVFGLRPRLAPLYAYAVVTWSFVVQLVAALVTTNRLVIDSSLFHHMAPAPATDPNLTSAVWLIGLGAVAAAGGIAAFERRDLVSS